MRLPHSMKVRPGKRRATSPEPATLSKPVSNSLPDSSPPGSCWAKSTSASKIPRMPQTSLKPRCYCSRKARKRSKVWHRHRDHKSLRIENDRRPMIVEDKIEIPTVDGTAEGILFRPEHS